jgi:hypothetical protein
MKKRDSRMNKFPGFCTAMPKNSSSYILGLSLEWRKRLNDSSNIFMPNGQKTGQVTGPPISPHA